ncbi:MAG TPA: serine hydrolase domain-containing protein [Longimicrobiaceae bacterium]|nr:serine hydrolase domain-containing protein [Longimicrobiaceae bacterium]
MRFHPGVGSPPTALLPPALAVLVLLLLGMAHPLGGQLRAAGPLDSAEVERFLDTTLVRRMAESRVPGASVAMVRDGKLLLAKGYGYGDLARREPVDPGATVFRVGSVSKVPTAVAVLQLAERGELDLHADVDRYLGGRVRVDGPFREPVTAAHLLTHTGGFDERFIGMAARSPAEAEPLGEYLARRMPPRVAPPGELIRYSNHGMALAGYLVEEVSGVPFERYVEERVLLPLGMRRSGFGPVRCAGCREATGYRLRGDRLVPARPDDLSQIAPAASFRTTALDMVPFLLAHLQEGQAGGGRILRPETMRGMHRRQVAHHPFLPGVAYGLFEHFENGRRALWHGGSWNGFTSLFFLLPDEEVGLFVAYNGEYQPELVEGLVSAFLDHYYPAPGPLPPPSGAAGAPGGGLAGWYRPLPYARRGVEKLVALFSQHAVRLDDDGRVLEVRFPGDGGTGRWAAAAPLAFRRVDEGLLHGPYGRAAFVPAADGRPAILSLGARALEKLAWYDTTAFHLVLLALSALVFLSVCVARAAGWLRRTGRRDPPASSAARGVHTLAGAVCALNTAFLLGGAAILWLGAGEGGIVFLYGFPPALRVLLVLPVVSAALTAALAGLLLLTWRRPVPRRAAPVLVALAGAGFLWFLYYWNLLGFNY